MPTSDFMPDVASVGALLRARTRDTNGSEVGTFTEHTRPTGDQVLSLTRTAAGDLASFVGPNIPEPFHDAARQLAVYRTAMLIELSFFPEQVALGRSPYPQVADLYTSALAGLRVAIEASGGDVPGEPGAADGGGASAHPPSYAFPMAPLGLNAVLGVPLGAPLAYGVGGSYVTSDVLEPYR